MKTIDACGLSCPEPLMLLKKEMDKAYDLILLVDNKAAQENCEAFATDHKALVMTTTENGVYKLRIVQPKPKKI